MNVLIKENNSRINKAYEILMIVLALMAVSMLTVEFFVNLSSLQQKLFDLLDTSVLIIFAVDYFARLILSKDKKYFLKHNIPDIIAIIPFSSVFRIARLARLARVMRLSKLNRLVRAGLWIGRFKDKLVAFIKTNGFIYMIIITIVITLIGSVGIHILEGMDFTDSFWWSFVTITTVGYGDISPESIGGRILAAVLMLTGIGFIGMLTGTIATFFLGEEKRKNKSYKDEAIDSIKLKLDNFQELTDGDIENIYKVLKALIND